MGKELKDDLFIYSYDIINESTVQVMIKAAEWYKVLVKRLNQY